MEEEKLESENVIQAMVIVDIDPSLQLFKPTQQKWISSLELLSQLPRQSKPNTKAINLTIGIYLQVSYCEKNRPPIYDIQFLNEPSTQWIALKSPQSVCEKFGQAQLCYKAGVCAGSEPLTDIELLITERKRINEEKQVFILPTGYKIVHNNPIVHSYLISKRMRGPLEQTFKASILQKYPQQYSGVTLSMLPLFCFPDGIHLSKELKGFINFNFILTTEIRDRFYCNCLTFKESLSNHRKNQLGIPTGENIFYEKSICLISKYRYTDEFEECLRHLYRLSMSKHDIPFHKVISSFVKGLKLPKQLGTNGMSYSYGGSNINFDTNPSYPIISERAIYCMFKFLPLQAIISVFEAILLQKKVIFVSQSKTVLGYAVQAFLAFIFPFRWEHVLIPILPSTLKEYMTAPVPLIVGISQQMLDRTIESDSIVVQLDNGTLLNDEDLPPLPDKMEKQLRKRLQFFELYDQEDVKEYLENPQSTYIFKMQEVEHPEFQGHLIRDSFFEFILTLMKNYKKFWKNQKYKDSKENSSIGLTEPQLLNEIFRLQDFLSDLGMTKVGSFGYKLSQTTLFTSFIERKQQIIDEPQLLFFDSSIDKKKAKKDCKLIQKWTNLRYNVVEHPKPQKQKKMYQYDSFPSILERDLINEEQIVVQLDEINEEQLEFLEDFLQYQYSINKKLYPQINSDVIDYKMERLLIDKYRIKFIDYFSQMRGGGINESIRSSIISKHKSLKQMYQKLQYFKKIYKEQINYIDQMLLSWPSTVDTAVIKPINKLQFFDLNIREKFDESQLICLYEDYGSKYRNFQALILGSTRINILDNREQVHQVSFENTHNSKKQIKYQYEIYVEHLKVRNLINTMMMTQGSSFFTFALSNLQKDNAAVWNIQVLLDWRSYLCKK